MESSSEDSFAWTGTSSEKSENETMANGEDSDFDKSFKRKLQKELFQNGDHEERETDEPRVKKKKKIKAEPSSPPRVKREAKGHDAVDAELYLRQQVKRERGAPASPPASPRARKRARSARPGGDAHESDPSERAAEPPRKKKRKKKTLDRADAIVDEFEADEIVDKFEADEIVDKFEADEIVDKFEADETVVEERRPESRAAPRAPLVRESVDDELGSGDEPPAPAAPPPGALETRERIAFEEEPDERSPSPESAAGGRARGRLARYVRARRLREGDAPPAAALAGHELWLLHAPRGLPAAALAGCALAVGARCRLAAAGRRLDALPEPAPARVALLAGAAGARRLRGAALAGAWRLRERVPRGRAPPAAPPSPPRAVPLPPTRARHPLLGADCGRAPQPPRSREPAPEGAPRERRKRRKRAEARRSPPPPAGWDSERGIEASLFGR